VVLPVAPFFVTGSKLQLFSSMGLNDQMVAQKNFKIKPQIKQVVVPVAPLFLTRSKLQICSRMALKHKIVA
jgi:hypothetical protein